MVIEYGSLVSLIQIMHSFRCETSNDASTLNLSQYVDRCFCFALCAMGPDSFYFFTAQFLFFFFLFEFVSKI